MKKILLIAVVALMSITASAQGPKTGFRFGFNTGYVVATPNECYDDNWNFDFIAGYQIIPALYVGGGVGVDVYTKGYRDVPTDLPLFGEVKVFVPNSSNVQPYVGIRGGYAINIDKTVGKGILDFTLGMEFAKFVNVGIGYSARIYDPEDGASSGGLLIRVGCRF